jgi:hypothetical protein
MYKSRATAALASITVTLGVGTAVIASAAAKTTAKGAAALSGTLKLSPGKAGPRVDGKVSYVGTYFRMIEPGGTDNYFANPASTAADKTYTLLRPGTHRGLKLGAFQPAPSPAFSASGNALANSIVQPATFATAKFSISTSAKDPQTGKRDPVPSLKVKGSKITGNLTAWTAEWNKIYFNQGSPKPGGATASPTQPVTGTYNAKTKAFTITWYSAIIGGPFNGFTGFWHLQGTLKG